MAISVPFVLIVEALSICLRESLEPLPNVFSLSGQRTPCGRARSPSPGEKIIDSHYRVPAATSA
jgi:hypothetical protein